MLTPACLVKDTELMEDLKYIVDSFVLQGLKEGKTAQQQRRNVHIDTIYNALTKAGIEIDMQSVGHIYNEVNAAKNYKHMMSPDMVEHHALQEYERAVTRAAQLTPTTREQRMGKLSQEKSIATKVLNTLKNVHAPDEVTKSMMKEMEAIYWKALQRQMANHGIKLPARPKDNRTWLETLQHYLDVNGWGHTDMNGKLNTIQDLHNAAMKELMDSVGHLEGALGDTGDPATVEKYQKMVDILNANAMSIFFSTKDARKIRNGIFKEAGYKKEVMRNGKPTEVMDWNKMAGDHANVADLRATVDKVLTQKGFRPDVIEAIKDSMEHEFNDLHAENMLQQKEKADEIARAAQKTLMDDPDVQKFLNGRTPKDWIREAHVEDVSDVAEAVDNALAGKEYQQNVRDKIVKRLTEFFDKTYAKVATKDAQKALNEMGIEAPVPRPERTDAMETASVMRKNADQPTLENFRKLSGKLTYKEIAEQYHSDKKAGANKPFTDAVDDFLNKQSPPFEGMTPMEWIKKHGVDSQGALNTKLDEGIAAYEKKIGRTLSDQDKTRIKDEFNRIMNIDKRAQKELDKRVKLQQRAATRRQKQLRVSKNDMQRLAELTNLKVFNGSHQSLIDSLAGIKGLQKQDLADLEAFGKATSTMIQHWEEHFGEGAHIYGQTGMQEIQNRINQLIARNVNNKTALVKTIQVLQTLVDVSRSLMLSGPFTILKNLLNNNWQTLGMAMAGMSTESIPDKQARRLFRKVAADVIKTGNTYRSSLSFFSPNMSTLRDYQIGWNKQTGIPKNLYKNLIGAMLFPAKAGQAALDAGFLVTSTNAIFREMYIEALVNAGFTEEDAAKKVNEALNNQSWDDARKLARESLELMESMLPEHQRKKITDSRVERWANDIVKHNLVMDGAIDNAMIETLLNSAFHVASGGLGHVANNQVSRMVASWRGDFHRAEQKLAQKEQWDRLAWMRLGHMVYDVAGVQFLGGGTNWTVMKINRNTGIPALVTAWQGRGQRGWRKPIDWKQSKKDLEDAMTDRWKAKSRISNAVGGVIGAVVMAALMYFIDKMMGSDEEKAQIQVLQDKAAKALKNKDYAMTDDVKNSLQAISDHYKHDADSLRARNNIAAAAKADPFTWKMYKILNPGALVMNAYRENSKNQLYGIYGYFNQELGLEYTPAATFAQIGKMAYQGNNDAAMGIAARWMSDKMTMPVWRPLNEYYQLAKLPFTGKYETPVYLKPSNLTEGWLGGGGIQQLSGWPKPWITGLQGIGADAFQKYQDIYKITTIEDLRDHPNWPFMKGHDGKFILGPKERKAAIDSYTKYANQTWGTDKQEEDEAPVLKDATKD